MLQNKRSNSHSLYSMTSVVVLFAYPIMLNSSTRNGVTKILPRKLYCYLSDVSNTTIKMSDKISFHKHFKYGLTFDKIKRFFMLMLCKT